MPASLTLMDCTISHVSQMIQIREGEEATFSRVLPILFLKIRVFPQQRLQSSPANHKTTERMKEQCLKHRGKEQVGSEQQRPLKLAVSEEMRK